MIIDPISEKQARAKLQKLLDWNHKRYHNYQDSNLVGNNGVGYVEYHITRMYNEFGGNWNELKAREYLNALGAEEGLRDI